MADEEDYIVTLAAQSEADPALRQFASNLSKASGAMQAALGTSKQATTDYINAVQNAAKRSGLTFEEQVKLMQETNRFLVNENSKRKTENKKIDDAETKHVSAMRGTTASLAVLASQYARTAAASIGPRAALIG